MKFDSRHLSIEAGVFLYGKGDMFIEDAWITSWIEAFYLLNNEHKFPHLIDLLCSSITPPISNEDIFFDIIETIHTKNKSDKPWWKEFKQLRQEVDTLLKNNGDKLQILENLYNRQVAQMNDNQKITVHIGYSSFVITTSTSLWETLSGIDEYSKGFIPDGVALAVGAKLGIVPQADIINSIKLWVNRMGKPGVEQDPIFYQIIIFDVLTDGMLANITDPIIKQIANNYSYVDEDLLRTLLLSFDGLQLAALWFNSLYRDRLSISLGRFITIAANKKKIEPTHMLDKLWDSMLSLETLPYLRDIGLLMMYDTMLTIDIDYKPAIEPKDFKIRSEKIMLKILLLNKLSGIEEKPPLIRLAKEFGITSEKVDAETFINIIDHLYTLRTKNLNYLHL